jgi:hypothetical protein
MRKTIEQQTLDSQDEEQLLENLSRKTDACREMGVDNFYALYGRVNRYLSSSEY